jgi:hypothetical protein
MALEVFFRDDIANILYGVSLASTGAPIVVREFIAEMEQRGKQPDLRELGEKIALYERGYNDALIAAAVAFGVLPE